MFDRLTLIFEILARFIIPTGVFTLLLVATILTLVVPPLGYHLVRFPGLAVYHLVRFLGFVISWQPKELVARRVVAFFLMRAPSQIWMRMKTVNLNPLAITATPNQALSEVLRAVMPAVPNRTHPAAAMACPRTYHRLSRKPPPRPSLRSLPPWRIP